MHVRPVLALSLAVAGCVGTLPDLDKDDTAQPGDDDDSYTVDSTVFTTTVTDTARDHRDSGDRPQDFLVTYMLIQADLGFDAATNALVDIDAQGLTIEPALYFFFGTEAWYASGFDLAVDSEYCVVVLPLTSAALAPWAAADPTVWYGVDYTGGVGGALTDCDTPGKDVPDGLLGPDLVGTLIDGYGGWGVGIGEFGASLYATYGPTGTVYDFLMESCVGARIWSAGSSYGQFVEPSDFYALPVEIDPVTHEAQLYGTELVGVPPADVNTGVGIATAWYRVFGIYFYVFDYP